MLRSGVDVLHLLLQTLLLRVSGRRQVHNFNFYYYLENVTADRNNTTVVIKMSTNLSFIITAEGKFTISSFFITVEAAYCDHFGKQAEKHRVIV